MEIFSIVFDYVFGTKILFVLEYRFFRDTLVKGFKASLFTLLVLLSR